MNLPKPNNKLVVRMNKWIDKKRSIAHLAAILSVLGSLLLFQTYASTHLICSTHFGSILERWAGVAKPTTSFAGRRVLVTGANTGIGFEAAATLASLDADHIILGVRNMDKGMEARRKIEARGQGKSNVHVWELDMGDYSSVQRFAARIEKEMPRLDVAILNAGISPNDYVVGVEGWESILQVNVMATALLGLLLLPRLRASTAVTHDLSHLVIVTSTAHTWLELSDFPDTAKFGGSTLRAVSARPSDGNKWNPLLQNARSKLFAMYVSESLAALATGPNGKPEVIVTSVCPGACKSDLMRDLLGKSFSQTLTLRVFDILFNKPTEQGGWSYVRAAVLPSEGHGRWYKTTALTQAGDLVTSDQGKIMQRQVWTEIVESLGSRVPSDLASVPDRLGR